MQNITIKNVQGGKSESRNFMKPSLTLRKFPISSQLFSSEEDEEESLTPSSSFPLGPFLCLFSHNLLPPPHFPFAPVGVEPPSFVTVCKQEFDTKVIWRIFKKATSLY